MIISNSDLSPVADLYSQGLYLRAYELAQSLCPLDQWDGTAARLLAGRLAANLGAPSLCRAHHLRAWRHDRTDGQACYYYARLLCDYRGPFAAWKFLREHGDLIHSSSRLQADWLANHASVLGRLRDFDAAEEWLLRAEKMDPDNPWVCVESAFLMELEDRYDQSLVSSRRSLSLHPWFRPGVQAAAHTLVLLDRDEEALKLLKEAAETIESGLVVAQLVELQIELGHFAEAWQSLERFAELSPIMEQGVAQWLNERRSKVAYLCGDLVSAARYAALSADPSSKALAERLLQSDTDGRRVLLPVGFVRQHHMTCVPATLSTISRFWSMAANHLSLAEAICYDGTPAHSERRWAEENGWAVREFCVNWEDTVALLDRGIVFTLTTIEPANAHLQAVIGYDSRRGTLSFRDPYIRTVGEYPAEGIFQRYLSTGPRGMALVPAANAALFDGLHLKEAKLYDQLYEVQGALVAHDRAKAHEILEAMSNDAGDHRLTLQAQMAIASYDADQIQMLACIEKLLVRFPDDANLKLSKLSCLRTQARRSERMDFLKSICSQKHSDPLFWQYYAQELMADAREHRAALRLLHRVFRFRPLEAGNFQILASLLWSHGRFDEALELYRFAACLKDTEEQFVKSYFIAARHFKQTEAALRFLESRFQRFGRRSSLPARTLFWAYEQVELMAEARALLKSALELRPEDSELVLFAADTQARQGDFEAASALLAEAEGKSQRSAWLRTAAAIASYRGELGPALQLWRQVVATEPLAIDANRNVAQLLAQTEGTEAARQYLRGVTGQFRHSYPLHQLLIEWLRDDPPASETALHHLIEIDPMDAWAHRELALTLCQQHKFDQGFAEAELALQLESNQPSSYYVLGKLYTETGDLGAAKAAYREAIRLSVDTDYAITELMAISHSTAERREALRFVQEELVQQVIFGDGLLTYREHARSTLDPEEVLTLLRSGLSARPDLWHAWSAVIRQLTDMHRLGEALELARQATEKFPLLPRVWFDLALVYKAHADRAGEIEALQEALSISPVWGMAVRQLAEAYERAGELDKGRVLLEHAVVHTPLDVYNHGYLADLLWKLGEKEQALARVQRALSLEPGYDWAWGALRQWSGELNCSHVANQYAREISIRRPGEARSWLILARMLIDPSDLPERLDALERALALNPRSIEAHSLRARLLAEAKRFDEALAACQPPVFGKVQPSNLRVMAAWVESERGNHREAIEQMRGLVTDDPNDIVGWNQLANWYQADGSYSDYLEAARQMVRIAPQDAVAWGYLGHARLKNDDHTGAKEALSYAITLAPDYGFAGFMLFDLQFSDSDLKGAGETLEVLRKHLGGDSTILRELQLAVKREERESAIEFLRKLCVSQDRSTSLLDEAVAAMSGAGWSQTTREVLDEALSLPDANPQVGVVWVRRCDLPWNWKECRRRLDELPKEGDSWKNASAEFLVTLAEAQSKACVREFVRDNESELRDDSLTWGSAGYALVVIEDFQSAVDWFSTWESRSGVTPWMLWNYVIGLRSVNREREASEISRRALLLPPDSMSDSHSLMLSLDDALAGNLEPAAARTSQLNTSSLREWDRFFYALVTTLLDFHRARSEGKNTWAVTLRGLGRLAKENPFLYHNALLFEAYRRSVLNVARSSSNVLATVWAFFRILRVYASMTNRR